MDSTHKKALLLLKAIIFLYHEFTDEERRFLESTAQALDANEELEWVRNFINEDIHTAYERTRTYLKSTLLERTPAEKISYLIDVWEATNQKGYITEMEALAMIKLARDWNVETAFIKQVRR